MFALGKVANLFGGRIVTSLLSRAVEHPGDNGRAPVRYGWQVYGTIGKTERQIQWKYFSLYSFGPA